MDIILGSIAPFKIHVSKYRIFTTRIRIKPNKPSESVSDKMRPKSAQGRRIKGVHLKFLFEIAAMNGGFQI